MLSVVGAVAVATVLLLAPGLIVARVARVRGWMLWGAALPVTCALVGIAEILSGWLQLTWLPWGWLVVTLLGALLALPLWLGTRARQQSTPTPARSSGSCPTGVTILAVAIAALGLGVALIVGSGGLTDPPQAFDAAFHLSAIQAIRQGGNASSFGGLAQLYQGQNVYYPSVWHGIAALVPADAALASNAVILVLAALVWPTSVAALLTAVLGRRRWASAIVVAASGACVGVPVMLLTTLSAWPYALSLLCLPGVIALALTWWRTRTASSGILLLVAGAGTVLAHGAGVFNLALLLLPFLATQGWKLVRRRRNWVWAIFVLLVLIGGIWIMRSALRAVFSYQRASGGFGGAIATLGQALIDLPMYGPLASHGLPVGIVFCVLALVGACSGKKARVWVAMTLLALVLVVLVGGPQWFARQLGSVWYLQKARLEPLVIIPGLVLSALGVEALIERCQRKYRCCAHKFMPRCLKAGVATLALVLCLARLPLNTDLMRTTHDFQFIAYGTLTTPDEVAFYKRLQALLPAQAVVVGAPSQGSTYLWSLAQVQVVYPVRSQPVAGSAAARLARDEADFRPGSALCTDLAQLGASYYLQVVRTGAEFQWGNAPLRWDRALTQWDTTQMQLIAAATTAQGQIKLWQITTCDA